MATPAKLFVQIDATSAGFSQALTDVENRIAGVGKKVQNVGRGITSAGAVMTGAVTLPIVAGATAATQAAIEWESAWTGVLKTVDATPEQLANIETGLKDMSKQIPTSATDLAKLAEIGGQLGIDPQNLLKFTRVIADLQETTNVQGEEGALALAQLLNVMGTSQGNIDRVGASIVALGNNTATTEADIIAMAQRLAAAGAIVGLTEADVLSLAAGMSSVGIESEAGGSAMSRVFIEIANAVAGSSGAVVDNTAKIDKQQDRIGDLNRRIAETKAKMAEWNDKTKESTKLITQNRLAEYEQDLIDAQAALDGLVAANGTVSEPGKLSLLAQTAGLTNADFAALYENDPAQAIQAFISGLGKLDKAGKIQVLEGLKFDTIRIQNMLLSLSEAEASSGLLGEALELGAQAWDENSALAAEAALRYGTTESQLKILGNRVSDILRTVGGPLVDALIKALDAAEPFFKMIENAARAFADADPATQQMVLAIAGIAAVAGPALVVLGGLVTAVGGLIAFLSAPVGLAIVGVLAAIAAFGINQLGGWEGAKNLIAEMFGQTGQTAVDAQDKLNAFSQEFGKMGGTLDEQKQQWEIASAIMRTKWGEDWRQNGEAVNEFITLLGGQVAETTSKLDEVQSNWSTNTGKIATAASEGVTAIRTAWEGLADTWATLFGSDGKSGQLGTPIASWGDFIAELVAQTLGTIANLLTAFDLMGQAVGNIGTLISDVRSGEGFAESLGMFLFRKDQIDAEWAKLGWGSNLSGSAPTVSDGQFASASPTARSGQLVQNNNINAPLIGQVTVRSEADMNRIESFISQQMADALNVSIDSGTRSLVGAR